MRPAAPPERVSCLERWTMGRESALLLAFYADLPPDEWARVEITPLGDALRARGLLETRVVITPHDGSVWETRITPAGRRSLERYLGLQQEKST